MTTRKNAEDVLLFRRGRPERLSRNTHELIVSPVREHSRKPDVFFERVEAYARGPYLELFARQSRPGWATWGDERTKFDECVTMESRHDPLHVEVPSPPARGPAQDEACCAARADGLPQGGRYVHRSREEAGYQHGGYQPATGALAGEADARHVSGGAP
jgi:hypothetical protein